MSESCYPWSKCVLDDYEVRYELILYQTPTTTQRFGEVEYSLRKDCSSIEIRSQLEGVSFKQRLWVKTTETLEPVESITELSSSEMQVKTEVTYSKHSAAGDILVNQKKHKIKVKLKPQTFDGAEALELLRLIASEEIITVHLHLLDISNGTCCPIIIQKVATELTETPVGHVPSFVYQLETKSQGQLFKETYYVAAEKPYTVFCKQVPDNFLFPPLRQ